MHDLLAARLPGYDPGDSDLETCALRAIAAAGLPVPRQQYRVGRYRIDLAYPDQKIAIELMGWDPHGTRSAFDSDKHRAHDLVLDGWRYFEFTSSMSAATITDVVGGALQVGSLVVVGQQ